MLVAKALPPAKTLILIGVLLVALLVTIYLVYNNFLKDYINVENVTTSEQIIGNSFNLPTEKKLFDNKFFDDKEVKSLQNFGPLPLTVQTITRTDPFAPLISPVINSNVPNP